MHRLCLTALLVSSLACASVSRGDTPRVDYILAHAHGWVEVSIQDLDIPDIPTSEKDPTPIRPSSCGVYVTLDGESFVSGDAYPFGETPPYAARTGFRFPAPVGSHRITLSYTGCNVVEGKRSSIEAKLAIDVVDALVTELHFDGTALRADPARPDPVVSLDDVYEAVTGRTKGAR